MQFQETDGAWRASVGVYGRVKDQQQRPINVFEDVLTFERRPESSGLEPFWFRKSLPPLPPGDYSVTLVFRDFASGRTETREFSLRQ